MDPVVFTIPIWFVISLGADFSLLRPARTPLRRLIFAVEAAIWLALPLAAPAGLPWLRFFVCELAMVRIARAAEMVFGTVPDRAMLEDPKRFVVYATAHGDTYAPGDAPAAAAARAGGGALVKEGLLYGVAAAAVIGAIRALPGLFAGDGARIAGLALLACLTGPAITGVVNGLAMRDGTRVSRAMFHPLRADSLRDLWGRRWNLTFKDFCHRNIFLPLMRRRWPKPAAAMAVFVVSAIMHEYIVLACLGNTNGTMGLFFLLAGGLCLVEGPLFVRIPALKNRWARRAWTIGLMLALAPLFFNRFRLIIPVDRLFAP